MVKGRDCGARLLGFVLALSITSDQEQMVLQLDVLVSFL